MHVGRNAAYSQHLDRPDRSSAAIVLSAHLVFELPQGTGPSIAVLSINNLGLPELSRVLRTLEGYQE